jgi:hypothetical protein
MHHLYLSAMSHDLRPKHQLPFYENLAKLHSMRNHLAYSKNQSGYSSISLYDLGLERCFNIITLKKPLMHISTEHVQQMAEWTIFGMVLCGKPSRKTGTYSHHVLVTWYLDYGVIGLILEARMQQPRPRWV